MAMVQLPHALNDNHGCDIHMHFTSATYRFFMEEVLVS